MRLLRTVSLSTIVVMVAVVLTAAVETPFPGASSGTRTAVAAPARLEASFRDLPSTVRTGEILTVQVDVPGGSSCDGSILYRDNSTQALEKTNEIDERCRWDVIVPESTRRGEADVTVNVKNDEETSSIVAIIDVTRAGEYTDIVLKEVPGQIKRGNDFAIRLDVPDKSSCYGLITYHDDTTQELHQQEENKERCRWDRTVPPEVSRGKARVAITVTQESRQTLLATSFEVSKDSEDAEVLAAFHNLPSGVRRESTLPVRVLVPVGARCTGEVTFRSADNVDLDEVGEQSGMCRWSVLVPEDAKRGDNEVSVKVVADGDEVEITAKFAVDESSSDVDARFRDLPESIRRGDELEVRVSVPDGASCEGHVTFDDGAVTSLSPQVEKRERCLWSVKVPTYTPRGPAIVRVWIDDHGLQTSLLGNVAVEGRDDDPIKASWAEIPKEVRIGETFELSTSVAKGASCTGTVTFAEGLRWTLGQQDAKDGRCTWSVEVPLHASTGSAHAEVKVERKNESNTLLGDVEVKKAAEKKPTTAKSP